jgi:Zn-dependent alcohol dehydrogenase
MGASQIIVVEPIRDRREIAQKVGATAVLDPNDFADGNALIARLRQMTDWTVNNPFVRDGPVQRCGACWREGTVGPVARGA